MIPLYNLNEGPFGKRGATLPGIPHFSLTKDTKKRIWYFCIEDIVQMGL